MYIFTVFVEEQPNPHIASADPEHELHLEFKPGDSEKRAKSFNHCQSIQLTVATEW